MFGDIIASKGAHKLVREKRWVKCLYAYMHLNFQVSGRSHYYHTYHCNFFNVSYWLLTREHFTIFPEQLPVYFRFLSSDQQVNLLESRDVTLCKVTSLGQDTSCNRCPDNLLCQRWGVHLVLWFKLLSQFRARLSFWTSKLCQIPWVLNDANLELQEAMVTKVRDVTQSQTRST